MRAILTYHSIDASASPISISREAFTRHVRWLAAGRVRVTSVSELLELPNDVDAVALTFDDGFRNFGEIALPLLAEHGLPAAVFVVTEHVGGTNAWGGRADPGVPTLPLLDWDELARLRELAPGVTIGAHTRTHARLPDLDHDRLVDEIRGAAELIRGRTGLAPEGFAYPYGDVSPSAAAMVDSSYAWGCTTELRVLREAERRALLPRLDMYYFREPSRLENWGSARFSCYLAVRAHARNLRQRLVARQAS